MFVQFAACALIMILGIGIALAAYVANEEW